HIARVERGELLRRAALRGARLRLDLAETLRHTNEEEALEDRPLRARELREGVIVGVTRDFTRDELRLLIDRLTRLGRELAPLFETSWHLRAHHVGRLVVFEQLVL